MAEIETKPWWASKTVIAGVVMIIVAIASGFGIDLEAEKQNIGELIVPILTGVGGFVTIYGRVTAKKSIKTGEPK